MSYIEGESREQRVLFPEVLDDYISEENLVRFIDAFVDGLEMEELGGVRPIDWREKQRIRGRCDRPNQRVGWTREKESINGKTTTEI